MADLVLTKRAVDRIDAILAEMLGRSGAHSVLLIDKAGQIISSKGSLNRQKVASLATLSAANHGATSAMAHLFGEKDFTLHFHKGSVENIHFSCVGDDYLMITVFENNTHLGVIRLEVRKSMDQIESVFADNLRDWFDN